ncbi:hypothetical protein GTV32_21015 [Gordonia sp. SID5947]|uniref:hypothetical protein n=1 Tax=Gordonia sp. SID5947 TaxID=2690315 RepID=UPI00136D2E39|nr:hypothetical protein [Gordonia sp. SID5947]MYR08633.1 hypothetical protein [Gordonia sp. SID5947]
MFSRGRRSLSARLAVVAVSAAAFSLVSGVSNANAGPNGSLDPILPPGFPCIHTNVFPPVATWGWTRLDGHEPKFVVGPGGQSGKGSLKLENSRGPASYFHPGFSTPLPQLARQRNALGFMFKGTSATFQIRVRDAKRTDRVVSGFTTLVWQPSKNGVTNADNFVTRRDLARGRWWSTQPIAGQAAGQNNLRTLTQIADQNPRAWVTEYGVRNGSTTPTSYVDNIVYGCSKWDFEPDAGS